MNTNQKLLGCCLGLLILVPASIHIPPNLPDWKKLVHYYSAEGYQERYEKERYDALLARIADSEEAARKRKLPPAEYEPLAKGFVERHRQVTTWLASANADLSSTVYQVVQHGPVGTLDLDHGVRLKYCHFSKGLYFICHGDVPQPYSDVQLRSSTAEFLLRTAPGYIGHFIVWTDENDSLRIEHGGGATPTLSDELRKSFASRFSDRPDYEFYRKYREEVMLPAMKEHKVKRERELLERLRQLSQAS